MKKTQVFKWLVIVLSIHILSVQTGLLHGLSGKNESIWLAFVFAISYAVASAFIIYLSDKRWLIFIYALADGVGVELYYEGTVPPYLIVIYFALYTFLLIYSTTLIDKNTAKEPEKLVLSPEQRLLDDILTLRSYKLNKEEIGKKIGISYDRVNKILKEYEAQNNN